MTNTSTARRFSRVTFALIGLTTGAAGLVACSGAAEPGDDGPSSSTALAMKSVGSGDVGDGPASPAPTATTPRGPRNLPHCLVLATTTTTAASRLVAASVVTGAPTATTGATAATATTAAAATNAAAVTVLTGAVLTGAAARSAPLAPPPWWVDSCSLTKYIVRTDNDACPSVAAPRGTWAGASVFPGVSTGMCRYQWSGVGGLAAAAGDYEALGSAFPSAHGTAYADCPRGNELPADCGIASLSTAAPMVMPPPLPPVGDGGIIPIGLASCDVCVASGVDRLYVTLDPNMGTRSIVAVDRQGKAVKFPNPNIQVFTVPVPAGTFLPGAPLTLKSWAD